MLVTFVDNMEKKRSGCMTGSHIPVLHMASRQFQKAIEQKEQERARSQ